MILITGGNGQLGTELKHYLQELKIPFKAPNSYELDITKVESVKDYFNKIKPTVVYHCAAYTSVDQAEEEEKQKNYDVNVIGTSIIAEASAKVDATLVYISTDYVFDGKNNKTEYTEEDEVNPINEYGKSKALGENKVQDSLEKYYIIRTSWVFGQFGKNFVLTMKKLAETYSQITVINDQIGRPTWTRTLVEFMVYITINKAEYGIYHLSNDGICSWFEFAKEVLINNNNVEVIPVKSNQYPQKAERPSYSIMSLNKAKNTGFKIPAWQEAVRLLEQKL